MSEMHLVSVRLAAPTEEPVLLLREAHGLRCLPIWIGLPEATAIAIAQQGLRPPLPSAHDLLADVITALDRALEQVRIVEVQEGVFFAELVFDGGLRVPARPSDSVALALRADVPIHAEESVLAEAGVLLADVEDGAAAEEPELERFRAFLDSVLPEDFDHRP
jgi:bifunctional DNase/RNase